MDNSTISIKNIKRINWGNSGSFFNRTSDEYKRENGIYRSLPYNYPIKSMDSVSFRWQIKVSATSKYNQCPNPYPNATLLTLANNNFILPLPPNITIDNNGNIKYNITGSYTITVAYDNGYGPVVLTIVDCNSNGKCSDITNMSSCSKGNITVYTKAVAYSQNEDNYIRCVVSNFNNTQIGQLKGQGPSSPYPDDDTYYGTITYT